jgi:hypothetical protein
VRRVNEEEAISGYLLYSAKSNLLSYEIVMKAAMYQKANENV